MRFVCYRLSIPFHVEYVLSFEISSPGYVIVEHKELSIFGEQRSFNLLRCPGKKFTFFSLAVCILGGIKATFRRDHFTNNIIKRFLDNTFIKRIASDEIGMQIEATEQSVVVEHFLEVWHEPLSIYRVAMKTSTQLVVDTAIGHMLKGYFDNL